MRRGWVKRGGKPPHESYYLLRGDKPVTYQSTSYQSQNPVSEIQPQRYTNKVQIEQGCYVKEGDKYINPGETICKGGILLECMTDHGWKFRGDCRPK